MLRIMNSLTCLLFAFVMNNAIRYSQAFLYFALRMYICKAFFPHGQELQFSFIHKDTPESPDPVPTKTKPRYSSGIDSPSPLTNRDV